ncbi:hypothetical protein BDV12DRAFT_56140 [Aspergillus spectabilis]
MPCSLSVAFKVGRMDCSAMREGMLKLRHKALRGYRQLLTQLDRHQDLNGPCTHTAIQIANDDLINMFASCMLLLLYEKLAGEGPDSWSLHLSFIAQLCAQAGFHFLRESAGLAGMASWDEILQFLLNLFSYNDLVRSTSLRTPTLSEFYVSNVFDQKATHIAPNLDCFTFPRLIARIIAANTTVTDAEITAWDGNSKWLPSFALLPPGKPEGPAVPFDDSWLTIDPSCHRIEHLVSPCELTDQRLVSRLYRIAAMV